MPTRSTDKFLARSVTEGAEPTVEGYDGPLNGEVYAIRSGDAVFGIAGADGQAEAARKAAEEGRVQAESERVQAESARQAAEAARAESQAENDAQQQENNAQQLANNQAAQGVYAVVLGDGQYDPDTRKPTISGEVGKIYLVPTGDGVTNVTWMWVDGAWAGAGTPSVIETVSDEQIADVVAGEAPQGSELLDLSGLSEFWSKGSIQSLSPSASIPASADLDDYTEAGSYSCSAEASATVTNKPAAVEGAFLLYVYEGPGGGSDS